MSDKNTSTLQSYIDSASGTVQSVVGSLTGNQADQNQAERKKAEGDAKNDLSHAGGNIGGFSVSSSGVAANHPDRQEGAWNQTVGAAKETIGGALGLDGLKKDGQEQNAAGRGQEASGQLSDLGSGIKDRATGAAGGAFAGLTGNSADKEKYQAQHDQGKTLQRGAESDIDKQNR